MQIIPFILKSPNNAQKYLFLYFRIFNIFHIQSLCSELQVASEFNAGNVYKFNSNFYSRHPSDFDITMVQISQDAHVHSVEARNCYLRNMNTNANIYLTSFPEGFIQRNFPNVDSQSAQNMLGITVVLECYSTSCKSKVMFKIPENRNIYSIANTRHNTIFKQNLPNVTSAINLGMVYYLFSVAQWWHIRLDIILGKFYSFRQKNQKRIFKRSRNNVRKLSVQNQHQVVTQYLINNLNFLKSLGYTIRRMDY